MSESKPTAASDGGQRSKSTTSGPIPSTSTLNSTSLAPNQTQDSRTSPQKPETPNSDTPLSSPGPSLAESRGADTRHSKGAYLEGYVYAAGSTPSTLGSFEPTSSSSEYASGSGSSPTTKSSTKSSPPTASSPLSGSRPLTGSSSQVGSRPLTVSTPRYGSTPHTPSLSQSKSTTGPSCIPQSPSSPSIYSTGQSGTTSSGWTPRGDSPSTTHLTPSQLTERRTSSSQATGSRSSRSVSGSSGGTSSSQQQVPLLPSDGSQTASELATPKVVSRPRSPIQWPWRMRKPRWRRGFTGIPPSSFHLDIDAPNLYLVEQSTRIFTPDYFSRAIVKVVVPKKSSDYHDEFGSMLLWGSKGGRYLGDVVGGLPHGHGQHWVVDPMSPKKALRLLYNGQWSYGMKTGFGVVFHGNGQEYRGQMKNGEHYGRGCMKYRDMSIYHGEWWRGRKHGIGTYYYAANEGCYTGAWKKDQRDGWGVFYWPAKRRKWEGEWVNNFPYSGAMSPLTDPEYKLFDMHSTPKELSLETFWNTYTKPTPESPELPHVPLDIKRIKLRHPSLCIYSKIAPIRKLRYRDRDDEKLFQKDFQDKLRGSLPTEHLEAMNHAFHKLAPGYMHRTILHGAQIRRLINVARIDPDMNEGKQLAAQLQKVADENSNGISFNNFLYAILSYHDP